VTVKTLRRTQAERSASTQRLLLDATVACLVELGYGGTTTSAVVERAGVSRGAQLHHYGTRQHLMGAAVEHLAARRLEWVRTEVASLPDDGVGSLLSPVRPDRQRQLLDAWADVVATGGRR
jgi:AcrR family transcriptional regulator